MFRPVPEINVPARKKVLESAPIINPRLDKVELIKPGELPLWIYLMNDKFVRSPKINQLIN